MRTCYIVYVHFLTLKSACERGARSGRADGQADSGVPPGLRPDRPLGARVGPERRGYLHDELHRHHPARLAHREEHGGPGGNDWRRTRRGFVILHVPEKGSEFAFA